LQFFVPNTFVRKGLLVGTTLTMDLSICTIWQEMLVLLNPEVRYQNTWKTAGKM